VAVLLGGLLGAAARAGVEPFDRVTVEVAGAGVSASVPRGYRLERLAGNLRRPRMITFSASGDLYAGSRAGAVYRIPPPYRQARALVRLAGYPHSVAFRPGEIVIARSNGLYRAPFDPARPRLAAADLTLLARLPAGGGHSSRTVRVGPDGRLYVALGIAGNCSDQYLGEGYPFADRRGGVLVLEEGGPAPRLAAFATGLRNPVGFDWHPETGVLYASNNGPDHLGFEEPPEYFARLDPGSFHGMPWFQLIGGRMRRDPCIRSRPPRSDPRLPVATFAARNAPMAVAFVPRGALDPRFEGDAVVALHGSWATRPSGAPWGKRASRRPPKLVLVRFERGRPVRVDDLVTGFQRADGSRWARPVGVAFGPDGALYFTSDAGMEALFRLRPG